MRPFAFVAPIAAALIVVSLHAYQVSAKLGSNEVDTKERRLQKIDLTYTGNGPPPNRLSLCQGDCDKDSDCQSGLKCFQRNAKAPVPGCRGGNTDTSLSDYCVSNGNPPAPTTPPGPTLSPTVSPTAFPSVSPPPVTPTAVPTARPTVSPPPVTPPADLPLNLVYTGNGPPRNRLSLCQGDCDRDSDCQIGLKCFQRNAKVPVPGCRGGNTDTSLSDYCVSNGNPPAPTTPPGPTLSPTVSPTALPSVSPPPVTPTAVPTARPTVSPPPVTQPADLPLNLVYTGNGPPRNRLSLCQGDCDRDSDCQSGLECFQRNAKVPVPGCRGGNIDTSLSDYCVSNGKTPTPTTPPGPTLSPTVSPTAFPSVSPPPVTPTAVPTARPTVPLPPVTPPVDLLLNMVYTGNGPPPNPLSRCQGDCDKDSDCQSGLECFQRNAKVPVPGCRGGNTDTSLSDYCVSDGSPPAPTSQPVAAPVDNGDIFRLKLYWEQGYYWQESTREKKWCMRCRHNNCSSGNKLYLHECKEQSVEFSFIGNGDEKLIQVQNGKNLCLERRNNDIFLKPCSSSKNVQLWFARDGSFNDDRFKLSQKTYNSRCVTQRHHPKHDEEVEIEDCEGARRDETVYWNKWDP